MGDILLLSFWLGGGFLGLFFGAIYSVAKNFFILYSVISVTILVFVYFLQKKLFYPIVFFILGLFWALLHNRGISPEASHSWIVSRNFTTPKVFLGVSETGISSLVWGDAPVSQKGEGQELYFQRDFDLFYPLKARLKRDAFEDSEASTFIGEWSKKLQVFIQEKISKYKKFSPWLQSLLLGDRAELSYKEHIIFSTLGLYHLLVLSGLHFTFLGFLLSSSFSFFIRFAYATRLINCGFFLQLTAASQVIVCFFLLIYANAVLFMAPVQRAFLAYLLFAVTSLFGLPLKKSEFLLWLLSLQFLFFPMAFLGNSSFLSWASFLIILCFLNTRNGGVLRGIVLSQFFLTLLVAVSCGSVSFLGFFMNPIVVPISSMVFLCSFLLILDSFFPPFMIDSFLDVQGLFLFFLEKVAILTLRFPWLSIDLLGYSSFVRSFLLFLFTLFFCYVLKEMKEK